MGGGRYYMRNPEMVHSAGALRCWNCNRLLIKQLTGSVYELSISCDRCNTDIRIRCKEPIPWVGEQMTAEREQAARAAASSENGAPSR